DTTPPVLTLPSDVTIECTEDESSANTGVATATDSCGTVTITQSDVETAACGNTKTIVRTWTATDECGNATSDTQTITVEDTTPPSIDNTNTVNIEIECDAQTDTQALLQAWLDNNAGATANDSCSQVTWSNDYGQDTSVQCENGAVTVTFTATDECNNSSTTTATYLIKDTENPVIITPAADQTVECDGSGNLSEFNTWLTSNGGAQATDDCSSIVWSNNFTTLSDDCGMTGSAVVTFRATDACGNFSETTAQFTIEDTIAPDFTVPSDIEIFTDADCAYDVAVENVGDVTDEGDTCSPDIQAAYEDSIADGSCEGTFVITRTWTLKDDCDNTTVKVQTITISDNTVPTFTAPEDIEIFTDADCNFDVSVANVGDVTDEADNCSTG
ncbi:HYR-like domain-containing protein, partial [Flavisericum labens]